MLTHSPRHATRVVGKLLRDIPRHSTVVRRVEEGPLQTRHRPIDGALPPTGDARERVFGSAAESYSVWRGERASKAGNDLLGIDIVSGQCDRLRPRSMSMIWQDATAPPDARSGGAFFWAESKLGARHADRPAFRL